jgi:hypothetical protein
MCSGLHTSKGSRSKTMHYLFPQILLCGSSFFSVNDGKDDCDDGKMKRIMTDK